MRTKSLTLTFHYFTYSKKKLKLSFVNNKDFTCVFLALGYCISPQKSNGDLIPFFIRLWPDRFCKTPSADPHAGCCGEGELKAPLYPIKPLLLFISYFFSQTSLISFLSTLFFGGAHIHPASEKSKL